MPGRGRRPAAGAVHHPPAALGVAAQPPVADPELTSPTCKASDRAGRLCHTLRADAFTGDLRSGKSYRPPAAVPESVPPSRTWAGWLPLRGRDDPCRAPTAGPCLLGRGSGMTASLGELVRWRDCRATGPQAEEKGAKAQRFDGGHCGVAILTTLRGPDRSPRSGRVAGDDHAPVVY